MDSRSTTILVHLRVGDEALHRYIRTRSRYPLEVLSILDYSLKTHYAGGAINEVLFGNSGNVVASTTNRWRQDTDFKAEDSTLPKKIR